MILWNEGSLLPSGIPLTEERLNKFGFDKEVLKQGAIRHTKYFNGINQWDGGLKLHDHGTASWFPSIVGGHQHYCPLGHLVKYVHELQNLYVAVAGKELEMI